MIWYAEQNIQLQPAEGTSGKSSICVPSFGWFFIGDKMKRIPLTQGKFAIVDDDKYDWLNQWKWCAHKNGNNHYAVRSSSRKTGKKSIKMHRLILGLQPNDGKITDHLNTNALDNRRVNLRICTTSENARNQKPRRNKKYKGIYFHKYAKKWFSRIYYQQCRIWLGSFDNKIEAAKAYDKAAKKLYGEFARTNFL